MSIWRYSEDGTGRPLVLLHGIGMSRAAWTAVLPYLRASRRVIAFDIAGFGETPPLPRGVPPTVINLVDAFQQSIEALGLPQPIDIAGNSLGGIMALEAARRGIARSVVAISAPNLWKGRGAPHVPLLFKTLRFASTRAPRLVHALMQPAWLRELLLAVPLSIGSRRMPPGDADRLVDDLAAAVAFESTFANTLSPFPPFPNQPMPGAITVAFGTRDWIIPKWSRRYDTLPAHARIIEQPGWGHVPMWIDPIGVSRLILEGTSLVAQGDERIDTRRAVGG
jgi:pimeloyl-ACP methyl ester carboxylesterase